MTMPTARFFIGDKTLYKYCKENGINYQVVLDRMRKKCLSPEEAINFKRVLLTPEEKAEHRRWRQRKYQRPDRHTKPTERKYLWLPSEVIIKMGHEKHTRYFYKGMRLSEWCKKNKESYYKIINRIFRRKISVRAAIEDWDNAYYRKIATMKALDTKRAKKYKTAADFERMFGGAE